MPDRRSRTRAARLLEPRELEDPLHERRSRADLAAHDPEILRELLGRAHASIATVSVAALRSDSGVFSWCDAWEMKSACMRVIGGTALGLDGEASATSISSTDAPSASSLLAPASCRRGG